MEDAAGRYRQRLMKLRELKKAGCWQVMEGKIKDFSATMPLIQALGNTALRDRHWQSLMREIGIEFNPRPHVYAREDRRVRFPEVRGVYRRAVRQW